RTLQRCGIRRATVLSNAPELIAEHLARPSWARAELKTEIRKCSSEFVTVADIVDVWAANAQAALVVRANVVLDSRLVRRLAGEVENVAVVDSAVPAEITALVVS